MRLYHNGEEITQDKPFADGWCLENYDELIKWLEEIKPEIQNYIDRVKQADEAYKQICAELDVEAIGHPIRWIPYTFELKTWEYLSPGTPQVQICVYIDGITLSNMCEGILLEVELD